MPPQGARRRLSSRVVAIGMLGSLSTALVACSTDETTTATCVDGQGSSGATDFGDTPSASATPSAGASTVSPTSLGFSDSPSDGGLTAVDDSYCGDAPVDDGSDGGTTYHARYFWYYGGRTYFVGGRPYISGGSRFAPSGGHIRSAGGRSLSRGGFGGHGGGGGGGEGGHGGGHAGS